MRAAGEAAADWSTKDRNDKLPVKQLIMLRNDEGLMMLMMSINVSCNYGPIDIRGGETDVNGGTAEFLWR